MLVVLTLSAENLRELRIHAGLSRPGLATQARLSPLTIRGYEQGRKIPSAAAPGRLAAALGCPVDALFRGEVPPGAAA